MVGRMELCVSTVVTGIRLVRRSSAGDWIDLRIDIALTRPPTPSETAAYGKFESFSTTNKKPWSHSGVRPRQNGTWATLFTALPLISPDAARDKVYEDLHAHLATVSKVDNNELAQLSDNLPIADAAGAAAAENASVENRWCQLRDTVQSTALAVLGRAPCQHQDWFDENDAVISNLLAEKNRLH
nr:unnamed protein product [Spirometra erinaceieuropaei]